MKKCRSEGVTASEVVRDFIETKGHALDDRAARVLQTLAVGTVGMVIGAMAAPSIAQALPGSRAAFQQMDANNDGVVTYAEFEER